MTGSARLVQPSVGRLVAPIVEKLVADAVALRVSVAEGPLGCRLIDAGATVPGSLEAGRRLGEICLGGLGDVSIVPSTFAPRWPFAIRVGASNPVIACLGSQYAGWALSGGADGSWFALGSGPARATAVVETLYEELGYRDNAETGVLVLETGAPPPEDIVAKVSEATGIRPANLTFIYAPTQSLAGSVQVVARVLEVALHKVHTVHYPLDRVVDGYAIAPLSPPHPDFIKAMGRTNDAIIYGGMVHLFVTGPDDDARDLAARLPSGSSRDYGQPFADVFAKFNGDFYAIDPMLFSPAEVVISNMETGNSFRGGAISHALLDASFG